MVPGTDGILNDTGRRIQKLKIITEVGGEGGGGREWEGEEEGEEEGENLEGVNVEGEGGRRKGKEGGNGREREGIVGYCSMSIR